MKPGGRVSRSGLELIKRFEGYRRVAAQLADGRWTVGYGHVRFARAGAELSDSDAEALLVYDLIEVAKTLERLVFTPLTQNQFDALASFAFNIGTANFRASSVLKRVNEGDLTKAAFALEAWRRSPFENDLIVIDALVRRRAAEKALFLTPDEGFTPAPTPVLPPKLDHACHSAPPSETPTALVAPLDGAAPEPYRAEQNPLMVEPDVVSDPPVDEQDDAPFPHAPNPDAVDEDPSAIAPQVELVEPKRVPEGLLHIKPPSARRRKTLLMLAGFSVAGLALFGFAVFSRLDAAASGGQAAIGYVAGIVGILFIFCATYLLFAGFGDEQD